MEINCEYPEVAEQTRCELLDPKNYSEWVQMFQNRADGILKNLDKIKLNRSRLRMWKPFTFSINITNASSSDNAVRLYVKYLGQNVALLSIKEDEVTITTMPNKDSKLEFNNERDFNCSITLNNVPWEGTQARAFRKHFKDRIPTRNDTDDNKGNQEKRIESLLLSEFAKSTNKALRNIKPVMVESINFPMPTPISASKKGVVKYVGNGGGVDILARTGTGGQYGTFLCVIEVKDENDSKEPPAVVIKQAIKYATFVRELIRSDAGVSWWKLFGFNGAIPNKLLIHAISAMPDNVVDMTFAEKKIPIEQDEIRLDCIYFKEAEDKKNVIESVISSLPYGKQSEVAYGNQ